MELFKLLGTIAVDNSDANKSIDDTANKAEGAKGKFGQVFSKIGQGAVAVGKTIGVGLAAGASAMTGLTVKALNMSGDLEQNLGGSEAVFKDFAGKMQEIGKTAFKDMGLGTSDFLATANKMGALFQGAGFGIEESADLSAKSMQRAADVASIMGIDSASAMEAVAGAAKGNFTMMDNLGVAMNDTAIANYALEKGINKSTAEMTQQEKIGLAMEMFMDKTAYAAGNYAKENETLAGSLGTAKSALTNFLDGSGSVEDVVSSISNAAGVIVKNVTELAPKLVSGVTELVNKIVPMLPPLLQSLLPTVIDGAVLLINGLVAALPMIIQALMDSLPALISGVEQIFNALIMALPQIMQVLCNALPVLIPQLISALVSMILTLMQYLPQIIQPLIDNLPEIIISIVTALMDNLPALINGCIQLIIALVGAIPQIMLALIEAIPTVISSIVSGLFQSLPALISGIVQLLGAVGKAMWDYYSTLFNMIWDGIKAIFAPVNDFFSSIWEKIKNIFSGVGDFFKGIFQSAYNGITGIFSKIGGFFKDVFSSLGNIIKSPVNVIIKGLNALIGGLNKISFDIPDWIPALGGKKFGFNIGTIPQLAKGGVLEKGQMGFLEGDGDEAVVPLEKNTGWISKVAEKIQSFMVDTTGANSLESLPSLLNAPVYSIPNARANQGNMNFTINIEKFENNRRQDVEELVDEIMEIAEAKRRRKGAVLA